MAVVGAVEPVVAAVVATPNPAVAEMRRIVATRLTWIHRAKVATVIEVATGVEAAEEVVAIAIRVPTVTYRK